MDQTYRDMAEELFTHVSFSLTERGSVEPMFVMILPDNSTMPIILHDKDVAVEIYAQAAHNAAQQMKATAMMLVCEHTKIQDKKEPEDYLALIFMTAIGESKTLVSKIYKDTFGTKYTTDERQWLDENISSLITPWKEGN